MYNKSGLEGRAAYDNEGLQSWAYGEPMFNPTDVPNVYPSDSYFPNLSQLPPSISGAGFNSPPPYQSSQEINKIISQGPKNRGNDSKADRETVTRPDAPTIQDLRNYQCPPETIYGSFSDAMSKRKPWMFKVYKESFESNNEDKAFVSELCRAIKSTRYARDNDNMVAPFRPYPNLKYPDARIECTAWEILVRNLLVILLDCAAAPQRRCFMSHTLRRLA
jgi:hypothetical protein